MTAGFDFVEFSQNVERKAQRLIDEGKVKRVPGQQHLWEVEGDHGTYRVRYNPSFEVDGTMGWVTCTCPLSDVKGGLISYCSHSLAALWSAQREHRESDLDKRLDDYRANTSPGTSYVLADEV